MHDINRSSAAGSRWSLLTKNRPKTAIFPATARRSPTTNRLKITISTIKSINPIPNHPHQLRLWSDSCPTQVRLNSDHSRTKHVVSACMVRICRARHKSSFPDLHATSIHTPPSELRSSTPSNLEGEPDRMCHLYLFCSSPNVRGGGPPRSGGGGVCFTSSPASAIS